MKNITNPIKRLFKKPKPEPQEVIIIGDEGVVVVPMTFQESLKEPKSDPFYDKECVHKRIWYDGRTIGQIEAEEQREREKEDA